MPEIPGRIPQPEMKSMPRDLPSDMPARKPICAVGMPSVAVGA